MPEGNQINLLEDGLVETLADHIGRLVTHLGPRIFNVVHADVLLIVMCFQFAAVIRHAIREDADEAHCLRVKEVQDRVIQRSSQALGAQVV